jgi:hypothetical protein
VGRPAETPPQPVRAAPRRRCHHKAPRARPRPAWQGETPSMTLLDARFTAPAVAHRRAASTQRALASWRAPAAGARSGPRSPALRGPRDEGSRAIRPRPRARGGAQLASRDQYQGDEAGAHSRAARRPLARLAHAIRASLAPHRRARPRRSGDACGRARAASRARSRGHAARSRAAAGGVCAHCVGSRTRGAGLCEQGVARRHASGKRSRGAAAAAPTREYTTVPCG